MLMTAARQSLAQDPSLLSPREGKTSYTLCFEEDDRGLAKQLRFEAESPALALDIAQGEAEGRWALLMRGDEMLCGLERESAGGGSLWVILSAEKALNKAKDRARACASTANCPAPMENSR